MVTMTVLEMLSSAICLEASRHLIREMDFWSVILYYCCVCGIAGSRTWCISSQYVCDAKRVWTCNMFVVLFRKLSLANP